MNNEIQSSLLDFISRNFMVDMEEIPLDRSLIDEGIIDSFGLIEISSFMENQFQIAVDEDDMTRDNFGSVLKMVDYIQGKINAANISEAVR